MVELLEMMFELAVLKLVALGSAVATVSVAVLVALVAQSEWPVAKLALPCH